MIIKNIVSEQERSFVNVLFTVLGDDEVFVNHEIHKRFRQLVKEDNAEMTDDEIDKCIEDESYYNDTEGKEFGIYIMTSEEFQEV